METQENLSVYFFNVIDGQYKIEFKCEDILLYAADVYFDAQSDFFNEVNIHDFYCYILQLMEGKSLNSENCHYALNLAVNEYFFCDYIQITFGYQPTLLNRYSEN